MKNKNLCERIDTKHTDLISALSSIDREIRLVTCVEAFLIIIYLFFLVSCLKIFFFADFDWNKSIEPLYIYIIGHEGEK